MKIRRFRVYAEREDLQELFQEFQKMFDIYYVPTYSDEDPVSFQDVAALAALGVNFYGILVIRLAESWRDMRD